MIRDKKTKKDSGEGVESEKVTQANFPYKMRHYTQSDHNIRHEVRMCLIPTLLIFVGVFFAGFFLYHFTIMNYKEKTTKEAYSEVLKHFTGLNFEIRK